MGIHFVQRCDLLGRLVIDQQTGQEYGRVSQLFIDTETHQAVGINCASGFLGRIAHGIKWADVVNIGTASILVDWNADGPFELSDSLNSMIGLELWTTLGDKIGMISDYYLEPITGLVTDYLFVTGGWQSPEEGTHHLPNHEVVCVGHTFVISDRGLLKPIDPFLNVFQETLNHAVKMTQEDYTETKARIFTSVDETYKITAIEQVLE